MLDAILNVAEQLDGLMPTAPYGQRGANGRDDGFRGRVSRPVGAVAEIERLSGSPLLAEVIGFRDDLTVLYPLSPN